MINTIWTLFCTLVSQREILIKNWRNEENCKDSHIQLLTFFKVQRWNLEGHLGILIGSVWSCLLFMEKKYSILFLNFHLLFSCHTFSPWQKCKIGHYTHEQLLDRRYRCCWPDLVWNACSEQLIRIFPCSCCENTASLKNTLICHIQHNISYRSAADSVFLSHQFKTNADRYRRKWREKNR